MHCPSCSFENLPGAKFCEQCKTPLSTQCPQCRFENPQGFAFCGRCGTALAAYSPSSKPVALEGERRHLTVMFCDLVGSTTLSELLDPEELREVIQAYQQTCAEVIRRFEGHIAQYLGDGLLVYFGYPLAHEDDAQRAVRTGIGILAEWQGTNTRIQKAVAPMLGRPIQVRIGIHSGLVVIGEMGGRERREQLALGDTPNIAARIQGIAEPDTVVISSATYKLTQGFFQCFDLGPQMMRGVSTPISAYRVFRESDVRSRFEVTVTRGLTPLVAREEEVRVLLQRWEQVKEGMGQVVLVSGEAGIGKSRLVQELKERVAGNAYTQLKGRCSPYSQNSAFYPEIELLQRLLQLEGEDSPQEKLSKLESALAAYHFPLQEVVPLVASLLSLPFSDHYPPPTLTPQKQRQKTLEILQAWVLKEAERQPVSLVWEDLQWADPSTLELLGLLMKKVPTARILVLLTFRPDFVVPWDTSSYQTHLALSRLTHRQVEAMVEKMSGSKTLPATVLQQVVANADGVPLFVEELTKMMLESGLLREQEGHYELTGPLPPSVIPATLQESLMARLDRLGTGKETAQLGATLGREFSYELLQAVSPLDKTTLRRELAQLVEAELFYQRGLLPQVTYTFKHALIQEAAYQSLLRSTRRQYHQKTAEVLERSFSEIAETQPELLAHHYTVAGLAEQAIPCWQRAGQRAVERSANVEAISHFTKGLELLQILPDTPEHTRQELLLQATLGSTLMATKGIGALEVEQAYARARELCQQVGDTPWLFPVLRGLAAFYSVRPDFKAALELGEQCLRLAQCQQDPYPILGAHLEVGGALFGLGEFTQALEHFEEGTALYEPKKHRSLAALYGYDLGVSCLCRTFYVLWYLGYPDQALKKSEQAFALVQEPFHPQSRAYTLMFAAVLHQLRREGQVVQKLAEAAIKLSTEQGLPLWLASGTILQGWVLAQQGRVEAGIAQLLQGLASWRATGAELELPYFLSQLVEAYGKAGRVREGLSTVNEAIALVQKNRERIHEAELYRLKGELLLQSRVQEEAEECFRQAIDIARRQSAKSLELRAVMSLVRLGSQRQGTRKKKIARQMLAEIYGWFTEGFETKDLQEAKMLLEEVS